MTQILTLLQSSLYFGLEHSKAGVTSLTTQLLSIEFKEIRPLSTEREIQSTVTILEGLHRALQCTALTAQSIISYYN